MYYSYPMMKQTFQRYIKYLKLADKEYPQMEHDTLV